MDHYMAKKTLELNKQDMLAFKAAKRGGLSAMGIRDEHCGSPGVDDSFRAIAENKYFGSRGSVVVGLLCRCHLGCK